MIRSGRTVEKTYNVTDAQNNYLFKRGLSKGEYKLKKYKIMSKFIEDKIKIDKWVPDVIVDYMEAHDYFNKDGFTSISTPTIYNDIRYGIINVKIEDTIRKKKYKRNRSRRINDKTNPFKDYDFICCSTYGNPRSKNYHFRYWKKLLKENDLPDIRFHDLRATYCTLLIKNNINLKAVSNVMGYATEIISVDVYGDNEEIIADCLDELEPFIKLVQPEEETLGDELLDGIDETLINALAVI